MCNKGETGASAPRRRIPRLAIANYLLNIGREVRVEYRGFASLFFVLLGQRDAFGYGVVWCNGHSRMIPSFDFL